MATSFYNCLVPDGRPVPWRPPAVVETAKADSVYFGGVLEAMESYLQVPGLNVYVTDSLEHLPEVGPHVVAVVIGDEHARLPAYLADVRAVFKNMSPRPHLAGRPLTQPGAESASAALGALRSVITWSPGRLRMARADLAATRGATGGRGRVYELPIGTLSLQELPLVPFEDREQDLFFAGSVEHTGSASRSLRATFAPKTVSRNAMLSALDELSRRDPAVTVQVTLTSGFGESAAADPGIYSRSLMNTRMALVPRGATLETFRFMQALRYGCVVLADAVSPTWFYAHAPVVQLGQWRRLPDAVQLLRREPARLRALHEASLAWWADVCSEAAVGRYMANMLNAGV